MSSKTAETKTPAETPALRGKHIDRVVLDEEFPQEEEKKTFFKDIEQDEDVVRGHIKVIQLITYAVVGKRKNEFDEWVDQREGRGKYFCQTEEDKDAFVRKHPDLIIESHTIQLKRQTAMDYLDDPDNMNAFGVK